MKDPLGRVGHGVGRTASPPALGLPAGVAGVLEADLFRNPGELADPVIHPHGLGRIRQGGAGASGSTSGLMKKYDKNGDGKLDRYELPGVFFDRLDVKKDGFVTEDELKALWKAKP